MTKIIKILFFLFLTGLFNASAYAVDSENWSLNYAKDPISKKNTCLMISATHIMDDGQSDTPVYLVFNGVIFFVKTKSNIDLSYSGLGLQIDQKPQHKIGVVYKKNSVAFTTDTAKIRNEFINGLNAKLTLGFWPSWPKTSSFTTDFDLHGFTEIHKQFLDCKKNGPAE